MLTVKEYSRAMEWSQSKDRWREAFGLGAYKVVYDAAM